MSRRCCMIFTANCWRITRNRFMKKSSWTIIRWARSHVNTTSAGRESMTWSGESIRAWKNTRKSCILSDVSWKSRTRLKRFTALRTVPRSRVSQKKSWRTFNGIWKPDGKTAERIQEAARQRPPDAGRCQRSHEGSQDGSPWGGCQF